MTRKDVLFTLLHCKEPTHLRNEGSNNIDGKVESKLKDVYLTPTRYHLLQCQVISSFSLLPTNSSNWKNIFWTFLSIVNTILWLDNVVTIDICLLTNNKSVLFAFAQLPVESRIIKHTGRRLIYNGNGTFLDTWQTWETTFYYYSIILASGNLYKRINMKKQKKAKNKRRID